MSEPKIRAKKIAASRARAHQRKVHSKIHDIDIASLKRAVNKRLLESMYLVVGSSRTKIPSEKIFQVIDLIIENRKTQKEEILSTQEVADLLNVSRPFVVKLIEQKELPLAFMAGAQRRVYKKDALEYREKMRSRQAEALKNLTTESEELELEF